MKWEEARELAMQGRRVAQTSWKGGFVTKYGKVLVIVDGEQYVPDKLEEFEINEFKSDGAEWKEIFK